MRANNSESMSSMFSTHYELICFFIQSSFFFFVMNLLGLLIIDQLFLDSINTLDFTKYFIKILENNWQISL